MVKQVTTAGGGGIGFFGLLTIVFITLKLCKVIDWSWWWVLSPMLFSIGFGIIFIMVILAITIAIAVFDYKKRR